MDSRTGEIFDSLAEAIAAGVKEPVEISGTRDAVQRVSDAVRAQAKAKRNAQKKSRRANR